MSYQFSGYKMAFFLEHDSKEVIQDYYHLFWNWRATSGKLFWIHDSKAYFWTDEEGVIRAYTFICLGRIMDWPIERKKMTFSANGAGDFKVKRVEVVDDGVWGNNKKENLRNVILKAF